MPFNGSGVFTRVRKWVATPRPAYAPSEGTVWTDTPSGAQYVYKSGVWMQSSAAQIKLSALPRNRIVNGAMQISQETATRRLPAVPTRLING